MADICNFTIGSIHVHCPILLLVGNTWSSEAYILWCGATIHWLAPRTRSVKMIRHPRPSFPQFLNHFFLIHRTSTNVCILVGRKESWLRNKPMHCSPRWFLHCCFPFEEEEEQRHQKRWIKRVYFHLDLKGVNQEHRLRFGPRPLLQCGLYCRWSPICRLQ